MLSRLARALWIEMRMPVMKNMAKASRLARALWIEIILVNGSPVNTAVEARESLVD